MSKETVTFRIDAEKRAALDRLAEKRDRDRSYLLNEAVDAYLGVHAWQIAHIERAIAPLASVISFPAARFGYGPTGFSAERKQGVR